MKDNSKYSKTFTFGPREEKILRLFEESAKKDIVPDSANEILRRGLHIYRYLLEVNESFLLVSLSRALHSISEEFDLTTLRFSKELAMAIFSIMIVKHGVSKAESFESIPRTLDIIYEVLANESEKTKQKESEIKKTIENLAISIDTIFLKPGEKTMYEADSIKKAIEVIKASFMRYADKQSKGNFTLQKSDKKKIKEENSFTLTLNEVKVLLYLDKFGSKTAIEISRNLQMPRTETYHLLSTLQNKGLVLASFGHPVKFSSISLNKATSKLITTGSEQFRL